MQKEVFHIGGMKVKDKAFIITIRLTALEPILATQNGVGICIREDLP